MFTLGINTATQTSAICLCKDGKVLAEKSWKEASRESEMLLPGIVDLLDSAGINLADVDDVLVVKGPGPFTGLRIGVVTANTFAQNLNGVSLHAVDTFSLLQLMADNTDAPVIANAGGRTIFLYENEEVETMQAEKLKANLVIADLAEKQLELIPGQVEQVKNLLSFAETCAKMSADSGYDKYLVNELPLLPYYVKKPSITL